MNATKVLYRTLLLLLTGLCFQTTFAQEKETDRFYGWSEEQFDLYNDSILKELYAPVYAVHKDSSDFISDKKSVVKRNNVNTFNNSHIPSIAIIDRSKSVGEIPIASSVSPTGAKIYNIAIESYPNPVGLNPGISLNYSSHNGNSVCGQGWNIGGLSIITRNGKCKYYDNQTDGIRFDTTDSFYLDGVRLIYVSTSDNTIRYETESGHIRAIAYLNGNVTKYFDVFYPDGKHARFGYHYNGSNELEYPITTLYDQNNNNISYTYTYEYNHYRINNINYNGAEIRFEYEDNRPDAIINYRAGVCINETKLLKKIACYFANRNIGTYTLSYIQNNNNSLLESVGFGISENNTSTPTGSKSYNPIQFYYGEGNVSNSYDITNAFLPNFYRSSNPNMIKVLSGKFDYANGTDGLIIYPNKNPYFQYYKKYTLTDGTKYYFDNQYLPTDEIFIYSSLTNTVAQHNTLTAGNGFIDIITADLEGKQEEAIIKINNAEVSGNDHLSFSVYKSSLFGISLAYTRTYDFSTVYTSPHGNKSAQAKYYYPGDFDGDGKMEVLAVSANRSFGTNSPSSKCYVFDLENNSILYQSYLFSFNIEHVGTQHPDANSSYNNSDKVFVFDYNGDGRSDICHIHSSGTDIYSFQGEGESLSASRVATNPAMTLSTLANRELLFGEFNGDGLVDLVISPSTPSSFIWDTYLSKGDGHFQLQQSSVTAKSNNAYEQFVVQDINGDGKSDLVKTSSSGYFTYLAQDNILGPTVNYTSFQKYYSKIVPASINAHSKRTQLICVKDSLVSLSAFSRNDAKEALLTGVVSSLGIIEGNAYSITDSNGEANGIYTKGIGAAYPYVNIREPLPVVTWNQSSCNGSLLGYRRYIYSNAVIHRQGLGFCGFGGILTIDNKGREYSTSYDPYQRGIIVREESPTSEIQHTHSVNITATKQLIVNETRTEVDDLVRNLSSVTTRSFDNLGYQTSETTTFSDGRSITINDTWTHISAWTTSYLLGFKRLEETTKTIGGRHDTERYLALGNNWALPTTIQISKNGNQTKYDNLAYNSKGQVTTLTSKKYNGPSLVSTCSYDSYGRLTQEVDPKGLSVGYTYDLWGRTATISDVYGGHTYKYYDEFGRDTLTVSPEGTALRERYEWSDIASYGALYYKEISRTGRPTNRTYYNNLNQEVLDGEKGIDGAFIYTAKEYDDEGNIIRTSKPFKTVPSQWTNITYDTYSRPTIISEYNGKTTTIIYNGTSETTTTDGITTTKTYDSFDNLTSISDLTGTVTFDVAPDGQVETITTPEGVSTVITYDSFGRRTSLNDPSLGTSFMVYNSNGDIASQTDADGNTVSYLYDNYGRLVSVEDAELTTSYSYNSSSDLASQTSSNGSSSLYTYDSYGRIITERENAPDGIWLQKDYAYSDGNISSITYSTQSGLSATENYIYSYGHHTQTKLNNNTIVFQVLAQNELGQPTSIKTGNISRTYGYDSNGLPTSRIAKYSNNIIQSSSYSFDAVTSNLISRTDNTRNISESFSYDNLNRLVSYGNNSVTYSDNGNITGKTDVGQYFYAIENKPYAVSGITSTVNSIPSRSQNISYTSSERPASISENNSTALFSYNGNNDRIKMSIISGNSSARSKYYLGDCYEYDNTSGSTKERLYLNGDYYNAPAVYIKEGNSTSVHYILRDHLGSITHVVSANGSLEQELSYNAWGQLRNPNTHAVYSTGNEPNLLLGRGYTGHEHLPMFGLVNMNARLYDPILGRFLSPDPYVQDYSLSQNFNRYSYALNNPLKYVDLLGEFATEEEAYDYAWRHWCYEVHYAWDKGEWYVCMDEYGRGPYSSGGTLTRRFSEDAHGGGSNSWSSSNYGLPSEGYGGGSGNSYIGAKKNYAISEFCNRSSYKSASLGTLTAVSVLLLDDASGVGVIDDALIPFILLYSTYDVYQETIKKQQALYEALSLKQRPRQGYTYQLVVDKDDNYKNVRTGELTFMKKGEIWKYGESLNPDTRYRANSYEKNFKMERIFMGNETEILLKEKELLIKYFIKHWHLPPGNKRFH